MLNVGRAASSALGILSSFFEDVNNAPPVYWHGGGEAGPRGPASVFLIDA